MNTKSLKVCWLSAGVSSFIAGWLVKDTIDLYLYIDVADQHPDSMRFIKDCEKALEKEVEVLRSSEYRDVEDVCLKENYIHTPGGIAYCTNRLKKQVRRKWEREHADYDITYVWGFDPNEEHRAKFLCNAEPEYSHEFPLIEQNMTKQAAHELCAKIGVNRPVMYDMGYNNNNCVGCVKGGMGYWNKIRVDFPEVFERRAKMERKIGRSCIKGVYLDELEPSRGRLPKSIDIVRSFACGD